MCMFECMCLKYIRKAIFCSNLLALVSYPWRAGLEAPGRWEGLSGFILYASVLTLEFYYRSATFAMNIFCKI